MARNDVLRYDREYYYKAALDSTDLSKQQIRSEYSRLRKIANKRIAALGRSEFADTKAYLEYSEGFAPLKALSYDELKYELADLANFLTAKAGSVSGQREIRSQTIETFREMGYTFINRSNYKKFTDFMEYSRTSELAKRTKGSNTILELFGVLQKKKIDPAIIQEKFLDWASKDNALGEIQKIVSKSIEGANAKTIKKMIDKI